MDESKFLTELKHSFGSLGSYFYKIPDPPFVPGGGGGFTPSRPFDAIADIDGKIIAIEAKVQLDGKKWPFSKLRESQKAGLRKFSQNGRKGFIFICCKEDRGKYWCVILPWEKYGERGSVGIETPFKILRVDERYDMSVFAEWCRIGNFWL